MIKKRWLKNSFFSELNGQNLVVAVTCKYKEDLTTVVPLLVVIVDLQNILSSVFKKFNMFQYARFILLEFRLSGIVLNGYMMTKKFSRKKDFELDSRVKICILIVTKDVFRAFFSEIWNLTNEITTNLLFFVPRAYFTYGKESFSIVGSF